MHSESYEKRQAAPGMKSWEPPFYPTSFVLSTRRLRVLLLWFLCWFLHPVHLPPRPCGIELKQSIRTENRPLLLLLVIALGVGINDNAAQVQLASGKVGPSESIYFLCAATYFCTCPVAQTILYSDCMGCQEGMRRARKGRFVCPINTQLCSKRCPVVLG